MTLITKPFVVVIIPFIIQYRRYNNTNENWKSLFWNYREGGGRKSLVQTKIFEMVVGVFQKYANNNIYTNIFHCNGLYLKCCTDIVLIDLYVSILPPPRVNTNFFFLIFQTIDILKYKTQLDDTHVTFIGTQL